jgi:hypothetical protein
MAGTAAFMKMRNIPILQIWVNGKNVYQENIINKNYGKVR